jgi:hypothetical protein
MLARIDMINEGSSMESCCRLEDMIFSSGHRFTFSLTAVANFGRIIDAKIRMLDLWIKSTAHLFREKT